LVKEKMVKISERLQKLASYVGKGEKIADIGTDHGFLPIDLWMRGISPHVILSDINSGPLEKAKANIKTHCPDNVFDIRLGSGLETIENGEVDTIIIAGMGGLLIAAILEADLEKTRSFKKYIFQPRNAQDKLRGWLLENGFSIMDEALVREGKDICEIIVAEPSAYKASGNTELNNLNLEVSPLLFEKKDPLLNEFIENKIRIEKRIIEDISMAWNEKNNEKLKETEERLDVLKKLLYKNEERHEY